MIQTYSDYITNYIIEPRNSKRPIPGEHHFVAAYLAPKLISLNGRVPDYINPDGTKAILGDVVYYKDNKHHFGIEVKLETVRLTRREYNHWILGADEDNRPDVYIGIGSDGVCVSLTRLAAVVFGGVTMSPFAEPRLHVAPNPVSSLSQSSRCFPDGSGAISPSIRFLVNLKVVSWLFVIAESAAG